MSRLPHGRGFTALLDGERVVVRRASDGSVRAESAPPADPRPHHVRVRYGMVEVAVAGPAAG